MLIYSTTRQLKITGRVSYISIRLVDAHSYLPMFLTRAELITRPTTTLNFPPKTKYFLTISFARSYWNDMVSYFSVLHPTFHLCGMKFWWKDWNSLMDCIKKKKKKIHWSRDVIWSITRGDWQKGPKKVNSWKSIL